MSNWFKNSNLLLKARHSLLNWFVNNKRDLPWRQEKEQYKVWISEVILQQTRVDQGMGYFLRFVDNFKSVEALAKADEDTVLKLWEGLGYYSRARNLHAGAKQIVAEGWPKNYNQWLKIKGVGPYTAAAISSIVLKEPVAAVDGNVQRVLSRLLNYNHPVNETKGLKEIKEFAQDFLEPQFPGDFNEAMMELGATVCKPKLPLCQTCPLQEFCQAKVLETVLQLPVKTKKVKVSNREIHFLVLKHKRSFLIEKRGGNDIWKHLYQFPVLQITEGKINVEQLKKIGLTINDLTKVYQTKHVLTHQKLELSFWFAELEVDQLKKESWYNLTEMEKLSFPKPLRQFIGEYLLI